MPSSRYSLIIRSPPPRPLLTACSRPLPTACYPHHIRPPKLRKMSGPCVRLRLIGTRLLAGGCDGGRELGDVMGWRGTWGQGRDHADLVRHLTSPISSRQGRDHADLVRHLTSPISSRQGRDHADLLRHLAAATVLFAPEEFQVRESV